MSAHTPGPWRVAEAFGEANELCFYSIHGPDDGFVASTWGGPNKADASLIAAAPEMLEALKAARAFHMSPEVTDFVYAAIAKAEGRS